MKKNNMLRIASVLLVAVLLSTCAISGAFAKYAATVDPVTDSARVAKFGITLSAGTANGFATQYEADDNETSIDYTVKADAKVVAPGTTGSLTNAIVVTETFTEKVEGDATVQVFDREVAVKVDYTATVALEGWTIGGDEYCPIVITIAGEDYFVGKTEKDENDQDKVVIEDIDDLKGAVVAAISGLSAEYGVNERIDSLPAITWTWDFTDATDGEITANDLLDTKLGQAGTASISIQVSATVTQID